MTHPISRRTFVAGACGVAGSALTACASGGDAGTGEAH